MIEKRIAVIFPGQGSQYVGMGRELYERFGIVKKVFDTGSKICGFNIASTCFEGPIEKLTDTEICQVCIFILSFACWKVIQNEFNFSPVFAAGHSLGEYTAFASADAISFEDALVLVSKRGKFMKDATTKNPGGMIAVIGQTLQVIEEAIANFKEVYISNINTLTQVVVGGSKSGIQLFSKWCSENRIKIIPLNVSGAFHTPLMEPAAQRLSEEIDKAPIGKCKFPVYTNYNGEIAIFPKQIRNAFKKQLTSPVQWVRIVEAATADLMVECGPKKILSGLIKKIRPDIQVCNVEDIATLNNTLKIMKL